jgi:hypothetical protein
MIRRKVVSILTITYIAPRKKIKKGLSQTNRSGTLLNHLFATFAPKQTPNTNPLPCNSITFLPLPDPHIAERHTDHNTQPRKCRDRPERNTMPHYAFS